MIGDAVRWALAEAAAAGDPLVARRALASIDPVLRGSAERKVARTLDEARRLTSSATPGHALRVAFLLSGGVPEAAFDDEAAVLLEFERERARLGKPARKGPWLTASIAIALLLGATLGIALFVLGRPFDPRVTPVGDALGAKVPAVLVAVDRAARSGEAVSTEVLARLRDEALPPPVRAALGPDGSDKLGAFLDALMAFRAPAPADDTTRIDAFVAAAGSLNEAMHARGLPYFVDVDVVAQRGRVEPWLFSFYVQRETEVVADGKPQRVVELLRLDRLNLRQAYLGYTRSRTGAALVLLEAVETELVQSVLPGVPPGEKTELVDEASRDEGQAWQLALRERAGAIVREHFAALHDAKLDEVCALLARRRALLASWKRSMTGLNVRLREPERLIPEADYATDLATLISKAQLLEWDELHARLLEPELLAAFVRARDERVASVQRHELEHRVDYGRGLMAVPEDVAGMLGVDDVLDASPSSYAGRVRDEYSAYLAELAGEPSPALEVMLLSRFLFDKSQWGGVYATTAFAVLQALGRELEIPIRLRTSDRRLMTDLFLAITARPAEQIQGAAKAARAKAFKDELPEVHVVRTLEHPVWRR